MLALGQAVAGSTGEAQASYDEATAVVAAMSDEELTARVDAAAYLCSAATFLDRYDDAVAHAERALRLGRAAGHLHPTLIPALGAAHFLRGRLSEAAEVLDAGVEAARLAGITQSMAWMLRNRSLLSALVGDLPAALEMAEEALALTQQLDESVLSSWAAMAVARRRCWPGEVNAPSTSSCAQRAATRSRRYRAPGGRSVSKLSRRPTWTSIAATRRRVWRMPLRRMRPRSACRWPPPGRSEPRRRSRSTPASPPQPRSARSPRSPPPSGPARWSRRRCRGRSRRGRSRRRATPTARQPSSPQPPRRSRRAAPNPTAMLPSRSCAGSAAPSSRMDRERRRDGGAGSSGVGSGAPGFHRVSAAGPLAVTRTSRSAGHTPARRLAGMRGAPSGAILLAVTTTPRRNEAMTTAPADTYDNSLA